MKHGRFKTQIEIATRLKQINLPIEQIMEVTKLTREEIEQL
jgi:predicted transposase YdaD